MQWNQARGYSRGPCAAGSSQPPQQALQTRSRQRADSDLHQEWQSVRVRGPAPSAMHGDVAP
jgi:hypothetical protein